MSTPAHDITNVLAQYYATQHWGGIGVGDGWRFFVDFEPESPATVIVFYDLGGEIQQFLTKETIEEAEVMMKIRGLSFTDIETQVGRILTYLFGTFNGSRHSLGNNVYLGCKSATPLFSLGKDDKGRLAFSLNFVLVRQ